MLSQGGKKTASPPDGGHQAGAGDTGTQLSTSNGEVSIASEFNYDVAKYSCVPAKAPGSSATVKATVLGVP